MLDHLAPLLSSPWLYAIVFAAVAIDGFLPVMPSETVVIGLGALSASGRPNLVALALAVVAGGVVGDRIAYRLGARVGRRAATGKLAAARLTAERSLARHGGTAILVGRFLPYGRTATTMTAGAVSLGRFGLFSALASAAWAAYAIGLGRMGGETFADNPLLGVACGLALGMLLAGVLSVSKTQDSPLNEETTGVTHATGSAAADGGLDGFRDLRLAGLGRRADHLDP